MTQTTDLGNGCYITTSTTVPRELPNDPPNPLPLSNQPRALSRLPQIHQTMIFIAPEDTPPAPKRALTKYVLLKTIKEKQIEKDEVFARSLSEKEYPKLSCWKKCLACFRRKIPSVPTGRVPHAIPFFY